MGVCFSILCLTQVGAEEKGKCGDVNLEVTEEDMMSLSECIKEAGAESWKDLGEKKLAVGTYKWSFLYDYLFQSPAISMETALGGGIT